MEVLNECISKARKDHRCEYCGGIIHKGDKYMRQTNVDDVIYTFKCHDICHTLSSYLCDDYGDGIEVEYWQDMVSDAYRYEFGCDCDFSQESLQKLLDRLKEKQKSRL